jgi:hypothetical protein
LAKVKLRPRKKERELATLEILTVTPEYVAHETAKSVPISASDVHAYILAHAAKLRATAENCKRRDLTSEVLK